MGVGLELGQGTAGIPKALCPDPMVLWGPEGCLSLISAKRLLLFVGKDCPARRQETTPQASHWTLTVSPSHIVHTTPKADRASPQPDLLLGHTGTLRVLDSLGFMDPFFHKNNEDCVLQLHGYENGYKPGWICCSIFMIFIFISFF